MARQKKPTAKTVIKTVNNSIQGHPPQIPVTTQEDSTWQSFISAKNWHNLIPIVLFLPSLYYISSANPGVAGWIILATGITLVPQRLASGKLKRLLLLPILLSFLGTSLIIFSDKIRPVLLDNIYLQSNNIFNLTINVKERLNNKTLSYMRGRGLENLWPIRFSQSSKIIEIDSNGKMLGDMLQQKGDHGRAVFLLGPAGSGKSPILQQWNYLLLNNGVYQNIFFVDLRSKREFLKNKPLLQELVALQYRDIISNPDYYMMLFEARPCLIILDEFEEVSTESGADIMNMASSLIGRTRTTVLIGARPENVLLSEYFGYLRILPSTAVYNIEPLNDAERDFFIDIYVNNQKGKTFSVKEVRSFLSAHPVIDEVTENLNFLNTVIDNFESLQNKTDYEIIQFMVERRAAASKEKMWPLLNIATDKDADEHMKEITKIAYQMSSQNKVRVNTEQAKRLYLSAFTTNNSVEYEFSPKILQSYFTVRALELSLVNAKKNTFSKMVIEDINRFPSLPNNIAHIKKIHSKSLKAYK